VLPSELGFPMANSVAKSTLVFSLAKLKLYKKKSLPVSRRRSPLSARSLVAVHPRELNVYDKILTKAKTLSTSGAMSLCFILQSPR
jgi:hypothetical protein